MSWKLKGESVKHDDDSDQECFRKYNNPSESFKDHALWLDVLDILNCLIFQKGWLYTRPKGFELDPRSGQTDFLNVTN
jgi:hypothetical protein